MSSTAKALTARDLYRVEQAAERVNEQLRLQLLRKVESKRLAR